MNSIHKEEVGHLGLKGPFFDFFLYYLPEFSQKEEDRKESKNSSRKREKQANDTPIPEKIQ
ncbi:hypothetical protein [Paenibacillus medicaginis]|uniref:YqzE family protein n=1 Tax=Paenibacillus medicaginis TaxID=1470560 RepID=A0ABV5C054_9BACL